jgi:hypothetical protein
MIETRHFHLRNAKTGKVRTEMFNGREHLVVPVVALMEGVIHAVNAKSPEFVPSSVLSSTVFAWNNRPLMLGHPTKNGAQVSANDVKTLESQSFGSTFNARMVGKKLVMDAYVDSERLKTLDEKLYTALSNNEMCEVSVGTHVKASVETGKYNGKSYTAKWLAVSPDHLAFLPGSRGACSIEMGCGAHRVAEEAPIVYDLAALEADVTETKNPWREFFRTLGSLVGETITPETPDQETAQQVHDLAAKHGALCTLETGDHELTALEGESLDERLQAVEMAVTKRFRNPADVNSYVYPRRTYDDHVIFRKNEKYFSIDYKVEDDGTITLTGEPTEVLLKEKWVAVAAEESETAACGCTNKEIDMDRKQRIATLLANDYNPVKCQKSLEASTDEALTALETHVATAAKNAETVKALEDAKTKAETELRAAQAQVIPAEELTQLRTLAEEKRAADEKAKTDLVTTLEAAQTVYTKDELTALPLAQLQKLATLAKANAPKDYSGQGMPMPRTLSANDLDKYEAPDSYGLKKTSAQ